MSVVVPFIPRAIEYDYTTARLGTYPDGAPEVQTKIARCIKCGRKGYIDKDWVSDKKVFVHKSHFQLRDKRGRLFYNDTLVFDDFCPLRGS